MLFIWDSIFTQYMLQVREVEICFWLARLLPVGLYPQGMLLITHPCIFGLRKYWMILIQNFQHNLLYEDVLGYILVWRYLRNFLKKICVRIINFCCSFNKSIFGPLQVSISFGVSSCFILDMEHNHMIIIQEYFSHVKLIISGRALTFGKDEQRINLRVYT